MTTVPLKEPVATSPKKKLPAGAKQKKKWTFLVVAVTVAALALGLGLGLGLDRDDVMEGVNDNNSNIALLNDGVHLPVLTTEALRNTHESCDDLIVDLRKVILHTANRTIEEHIHGCSTVLTVWTPAV
jgi:hypothetical protein